MTADIAKLRGHNVVKETFEYYLAEAENGWIKIPRRVASDLSASYANALSRIEELETTRDAARQNFLTMQNAANKLRLRAETAEKRVAELEAALRPFVEEFEARRDAYIRRYTRHPAIGASNFDSMPDDWEMENSKFAMGDYRRARKALGDQP